jgi:hypothetical protein
MARLRRKKDSERTWYRRHAKERASGTGFVRTTEGQNGSGCPHHSNGGSGCVRAVVTISTDIPSATCTQTPLSRAARKSSGLTLEKEKLMLKARLHPVGRLGFYNVLFDGELLVERSRVPELDAARALVAKGPTGKLTMLDGKTGTPRSIINIERAAKLTVDESRTPRFSKWKPMPADLKARQTSTGASYSDESLGWG